jgi:AraC-like DNA-binding protein
VNYAILFDSDEVRRSAAPDRVDLHNAGDWFSIPPFLSVEAGRLEGWRLEMEHIRSSFLMPTARNRLRAEMGVLNMLRHMIDGAVSTGGISPAERLKSLLDRDTSGTRTMEELCTDCGYSSDHLRILFQKEFGATPKQYRVRRRMAEAMEYIAGSRLSIKEISGRLGFTHLSNFSTTFKAVHNLQPSEALHRFRGSGQPLPPPESANLHTVCPLP